MSILSQNLQRKLSAIEDQEIYQEEGDSLSDEHEKELQKQNKEAMNQYKERFYGDEEEVQKEEELSVIILTEDVKQEILEDLDDEHQASYNEIKIHPNQYIKLIPKNDLQLAYIYHDNRPLLEIRKTFLIASKLISNFCLSIVKHPVFEFLTITVIIFNSIMLALDDPTTDVQTDFANQMDDVFLGYYTGEAVLKIVAYGFIFNPGSYLRDTWNILDFSVIITAYLPYIINSNSVNLSSLRSFRVLRPLRTVSSIKSLRTILLALFASIAQLKDAVVVLIFFYTIFAIAGVQLFSGYLKRRCFYNSLGVTYFQTSPSDPFPYCSDDTDCHTDFICGKQLANPQQDQINFDTFGWAFMQVFIITTLEGWTPIQEAVQLTFSWYVVFYFEIVVIVGSFFLVNLTLAVIKLNFKPEKIKEELAQIKDEVQIYNYWELRQLGLYEIERYPVDTSQYGQTNDINLGDIKNLIPNRALQRKQSRRTTSNIGAKRLSMMTGNRKLKVQFAPIKTAVYFSNPVFINKQIKIQGIYGMGNVNKSNPNQQQRISLVRRLSISSKNEDQASSRKINDNLISEIESITKVNRNARKSIIPGFTITNTISDEKQGISEFQNSPSPQVDHNIISGFQRVEGGQRTVIPKQHRGSVESSQSGESHKPKTPGGLNNQLELPKLGEYRQMSFNVKSGVQGIVKKKGSTKPPRNSPKPKELKSQSSLLEDEFDSVNLSELNTISDEELDARLEEMDIYIEDKNGKSKSTSRGMTMREQHRLKRMENRRLKEAIRPAEGMEMQLNDAQIKLKSDLFMTKFYPIIETQNTKFLSEDDVLATRVKVQQDKKREYQDKMIREMPVKISYNFKNSRAMIDSKKSKTQMSKKTNSMSRRGTFKETGTKLFKKFKTGNLRRIQPIKDDQIEQDIPCNEDELNDAQDMQQEIDQDNEQENQLRNVDPLSQSQMMSSHHQHHDSEKINSLQQPISSDEQQESQRNKKKGKKINEKWTFEQYKAGFVGQDCIIDLERINLVERDEAKIEKEKQEKLQAEKEKQKDIDRENETNGQTDKKQNNDNQKDDDDDDDDENKSQKEQKEIINLEEIFLTPEEKDLRLSLFYQEYQETKTKDVHELKGILTTQASIEDVLLISEYQYYDSLFIKIMHSIIRSLNYTERDYFVWLAGPIGILLVIQKQILYFTQSSLFEASMNLAVAINTLILAMDGLVPDSWSDSLSQFNFAFTIIFTIELGIKVVGMGPIEYLRDTMNKFDAIIVVLSLVELFFLGGGSGKSSLSAFRSVRIFRAFRVLRVTKLMRSLQFMGFLIKVLSNAFQAFMYILLLLVIFIFIFTLLGMAFFGGQLSKTPSRQNYDDLQNAFLVVFQVLTLENWNSILYDLLLQEVTPFITVLYLVFWIMIGNYVFLNLFLAILLEKFEEEYKKDKSDLDVNIQIGKDSEMEQTKGTTTMKSTTMKTQKKITASAINFQLDHTDENQKKKKRNEEFVYYSEPNLCQISLFIFHQDNFIRKICYRIVKDGKFESLIFVMIFFTSLKLVIDTYITDTGIVKEVSVDIDIFFAVFFTMECIMKVIALGFVEEDNSYLRESWNILDFFIVIASLIDISFSTINLSFVKILRLLRTLRPLRFITHNRSMKILVSALLQSINGIFNVAIVVVLAWIMFAILGINLQKNKLHFCNTFDDEVHYNVHKADCANIGGVWDNHKTNFDNILNGMLTLFVLTTLEGWPDLMYYFIDADEDGPIKGAQLQFSWYFVIFILFGSMLLMNLFIGVILVNYHIAEEASKDSGLTKDQTDWIEVQKLIVQSNPNMSMFFAPENQFRAFFFKIIKHRLFDPIIMTFIVCNIVTMGLTKEDASPYYDEVLNSINLTFTSVFITEAILKLIALGPVGYMRNGWNQFDFFVVCASILDIVLEFSGNSFISFLKAGPQLARVFRVLRVTRLFRLVKQFEGLQKLIETAIYSLPAMLNVIALLFLVYFIFSILGVFLFGDITRGAVIDDVNNFKDFHHAFLLLFRCSTGEDWYKVMFDTMEGDQSYYCIFFIIFILIQQYVMLNLFILIILDQYEINYFNTDNPLNRFQDNETIFVEAWSKYATEDKGMKMSDKYLVRLMLDMEAPLGFDLKQKLESKLKDWKRINPGIVDKATIEKHRVFVVAECKRIVSREIMKMNIYSDSQGLLKYHQILFSFMKHYMWKKVSIDLKPEQMEKIMQKEEETIKKLRRKQLGLQQKETTIVNPIVQFLFVSMSFKALRRYGVKKRQQREALAAQMQSQAQEHYSEGNSSNSSFDRNVEINSRQSQDSEHPPRPDYGKTRYLSLPNTEIYKDEVCLYNLDSPPNDSQDDQSSSANEDTNRVMQQYTQQFQKHLLDNEDKSRESQQNIKVKQSISKSKITIMSQSPSKIISNSLTPNNQVDKSFE